MSDGQTTITIPVDLDDVRQLGPGEVFSVMADTRCEVYVVLREASHVRVHSIAISADRLQIVAGNLP